MSAFTKEEQKELVGTIIDLLMERNHETLWLPMYSLPQFPVRNVLAYSRKRKAIRIKSTIFCDGFDYWKPLPDPPTED